MEHRWGRRFPVNLPVRLVHSPGIVTWGRVRNLSLTGAFVETPHLLHPGVLVSVEPVTVAAHWPSGAFAAYVIWNAEGGVGLEWCEAWEQLPSGLADVALPPQAPERAPMQSVQRC